MVEIARIRREPDCAAREERLVVLDALYVMQVREEVRGEMAASPGGLGGAAGALRAATGSPRGGERGGELGDGQGELEGKVNSNQTAIVTIDGLKVIVGDRAGLQGRVDNRLILIRGLGLPKTRDLVGWELQGDVHDVRRELLLMRRTVRAGDTVPPEWSKIERMGGLVEAPAWLDIDKFQRVIEGRWDEMAPGLLSIADFEPPIPGYDPWSLSTDSPKWRDTCIRWLEAVSDAFELLFDAPPFSQSVSFRMIRSRLRTERCKGIECAFVFYQLNAAVAKIMRTFRKERPAGVEPHQRLYGPDALARETERRFDEAYRAIPGDQMPTFRVNEFRAATYGEIQWTATRGHKGGKEEVVKGWEEGGTGGGAGGGRGGRGRDRGKRAREGADVQAAAKVAANGGGRGQGRGGQGVQQPPVPPVPGAGANKKGICGFHLFDLLGVMDKKTARRFGCRTNADGTCSRDLVHAGTLRDVTRAQATTCIELMTPGLRPPGLAMLAKKPDGAFKA